jgi:hypothetical protein
MVCKNIMEGFDQAARAFSLTAVMTCVRRWRTTATPQRVTAASMLREKGLRIFAENFALFL